MQFAIRRAPDGQKGQLEMELEKLEDKMPAPLPSIYTVSDDQKKPHPIYVLRPGRLSEQGGTVGARPLGILLPEGAPEEPIDIEKPG